MMVSILLVTSSICRASGVTGFCGHRGPLVQRLSSFAAPQASVDRGPRGNRGLQCCLPITPCIRTVRYAPVGIHVGGPAHRGLGCGSHMFLPLAATVGLTAFSSATNVSKPRKEYC